ncbi:hypothetical protein M514_10793 [Trichuris suis]|uniref:Saposin B-type domain-containing protein n=1 Tax=Trichuris suis TaxID=68888 RepID=A0A085LTK5_9BILA|nr:hypothetical protein M513_10793 [Trichuris suis]KFD64464.1 hypothetical protein M514_10793 [Trichuris suis]
MIIIALIIYTLLARGNGIVVPHETGTAHDCLICEYALDTITKLPQEKRITAAVQKQMEDVCNIPDLESFDCLKRSRQMVTFLTDAAVEQHNLKSSICNLITGAQCNVQKLSYLPKHSGLQCVACFLAMNLLDKRLLKYEQTIEEMFKAICNSSVLKDRDRETCIDLLENHFPQAYAAFVMTVSTKFVCGVLIGCPLAGKYESKNAASPADDIECHGCQIGFKYIHKFISNSHSDRKIANGLRFFCSKLVNEEVIEDCNHMISEYSTEIMNVILRYLEPQVICSKFHFCKADD